MAQRNGVTLTEVLGAIFVMGIGLLSLLGLFPLGALNMAAAIRDERAASAAANADAIARVVLPGATLTLRDDMNVFPQYTTPSTRLTALNPTTTGYWGPSYPVYIDPLGVMLGSSTVGFLAPIAGVSPLGSSGFARVAPSTATTQPQISRWFTLLDDITFTENGLPDFGIPQAPTVQREGRFTWAYLFRQNQATTAAPTNPFPPTPGDLSIVVYEKRSPTATVGTGMPTEEYVCAAEFTFGTNTATLTWQGNIAPPIRKGSWVLDATVVPAVGANPPVIRGYFYRVSGYSDPVVVSSNPPVSRMVLDLQTPVREQTMAAQGGVAVVMENVIEVFEKTK
jgi:hypothetical protein